MDGPRVRGAPPVLVGVVHRRQLQPVGVGLGQRRADEPGGVAHHEGHQLRRRQFRREDQVALVLPVGVVHHDDRLPRRDRRDRLLDRPESSTHDRTPTSFSTYLAITSTSRLTGAPISLCPNVVSASVVGIRLTANSRSSTEVTVNEIPSTVIEPLCTTYRCRPGGNATRTLSQRSPGSRAVIVPTPSTWPCTRWPPSRVSRVAARSRLTGSPARSAPRQVRSRVSRMTSAGDGSSSTVTTGRHTPLTPTEAPCPASLTTSGAPTASPAPSPPGSVAPVPP